MAFLARRLWFRWNRALKTDVSLTGGPFPQGNQELSTMTDTIDSLQSEVLDFWFRELTPQEWFEAGERLDPIVRERFGMLHEQAANGACDHWRDTPLARLALIIVLDQFSRHIHRGDARAFAQDAKARELALDGTTQGWDERLAFAQRHFFYMPLMHAEDPELQRRCVERFTALRDFAEQALSFAQSHADEITRFGRFPHRNQALLRPSTHEELAFLQSDEAAA
jgi:uncharacterized protein (DUF924 family)